MTEQQPNVHEQQTREYEKLGAFYLGRPHDLAEGETAPEPLLYDAKDLTTHAVCVGMTGSGKTGLCVSLLEEAGIDGIPAIVIDPKGDLSNLLLTFPELQAANFRPWIDEGEADRKGVTPDEFAEKTATLWRDGLAKWGQDGERIRRFLDRVDLTIYTPASNAGVPLTVLRSFDAPPEAIIDDREAFQDRIGAAASGLLALLGIDVDPVRSREHILISNILNHTWTLGQSLDLAGLIHAIQDPPFDKVGVMDLESVFPAKDRLKLSMQLNNLLAAPGFASWLEGEPVDIKRLLHTPQGKPRITIISIAHLTDEERMFFVTFLLGEVLTWMRTQPGTSSLRALLYMDEVFGYFPPTANPPSKKPMLTLLKQARAFGLGVVLATQNPVDLDYKGLSNTGTWFLGRLQTERDKMRVLEGLEGASAQAGSDFNRAKMEAMLAGLGKRVFLMNNAHEDQPVVFHTRWAMSYLRGPLTRTQIKTLMADRKGDGAPEEKDAAESEPEPGPELEPTEAEPPADPLSSGGMSFEGLQPVSKPKDTPPAPTTDRPTAPAGVAEKFLAVAPATPSDARIVYRPAVFGSAKLHYIRVGYKVDAWQEHALFKAVADDLSDIDWQDGTAVVAKRMILSDKPREDASFAELPESISSSSKFKTWRSRLKDHLYSNRQLPVWKYALAKEYSEPGEPEDDFRVRLGHMLREKRDEAIDEIRKRYARKFAAVQKQIDKAEARVGRETKEYHAKGVDSAVTIGSSIFGALFGRKLKSVTNVRRTSSSAKSVSRAAREREDVVRAKQAFNEQVAKRMQLEEQLKLEIAEIRETLRPDQLELEELSVRARKNELNPRPVTLVWSPWVVTAEGDAQPAFDLPKC